MLNWASIRNSENQTNQGTEISHIRQDDVQLMGRPPATATFSHFLPAFTRRSRRLLATTETAATLTEERKDEVGWKMGERRISFLA